MKKARTILAILLALVMVLSVLPASFADAGKKLDRNGDKPAEPETRIQRKTERTFASQVKRFKVNNQIDPEAIVTAIVVFDEPALSDTYTAEEIRENKAESEQNRLTSAHDTFFKALSFEAKRMYDYTALINGMSVQTAFKNIAAMEKMSGVKKVYIANEFNAPEPQKPTQANANTITGANVMQSIEYKGDGMVVAVLDTGLNLDHEAFQDYGNITNPAFTPEYVAKIRTLAPGEYVSDKIPFAYDYYDDDPDVMDYNGHGSHVSGTITGLAVEADGAIKFMGEAPNAQLVFMKIFADEAKGTNSGIYMAALEDCYLLGVDAINMSIGSPGGFVYDYELEDYFGNVYEKLDQAGIIVCVSAGNEYSMAHNAGNFAGDGYVLADYADYAEIASPSTYGGNVSVASMENTAYPSLAIVYNGESFPYVDNCDDGEHGWVDAFGGQTLEIVDCGLGNPDEIPDEVNGKIALVKRGDLSFSEKNENVAAKGAVGMILYNNQSGSIGMLIDPYYVPAISILQDAGLTILNGLDVDNTVTVTTEAVDVNNPSAWLMSTFSSWGCTPNLELKPTISAPGGMIYSAVAGASDAYEVYSGTSMASPNACGAFLLLTQYLKVTYPDLNKLQRSQLAEDLMESTATLPMDADNYLYSPRKSGSGILNIADAISTPVYFEEPIVNLYDDAQKTGVYTINYTLVNLTDSDQEYIADVIGLYDYTTQGYNTLTSDYLFDQYGLTVDGDLAVTVPANGTFDGTITIALDDDKKAEFDETFANGNYVEGYVLFKNVSADAEGMVVPVNAGLYGDADLNGEVSVADAAQILRAVVGIIDLSDEAENLADVNRDGKVTAADAAFILRAMIGLETLPTIVYEEVASSMVHLTFMGFYGDWTQAPVLDKIWTNSAAYLMYLAAEFVYYPQYAAAGYLPTDMFTPMETNIGPHMVYGLDAGMTYLYNYLGQNPAATLLSSNDDIVADVWEEYFNNDGYFNALHNAISNETSDGDMYFVEMMYSEPIQLRNARHLIMTVSDYVTDEVYYVDDTEYLGKAYFSNDNGTWGARGSFYWDGIVTNENSELYGEYVPNGTICVVTYETMVDYPSAKLHVENQFLLVVDTESPVITNVVFAEEEVLPETGEGEEGGEGEAAEPTIKKTMTVNLTDNGSDLAYADAFCYDSALDGYDLGYASGADAAAFEIDISDIPEDVSFVMVEALDYATNLKVYAIDVNTGDVYTDFGDYGTVEFAANLALSGANVKSPVPIEGIITDIYEDTVYVSSLDPVKGNPMGIAVKLAEPLYLNYISVGDAYVFAGIPANDNGCPTLDEAEITYIDYMNPDPETDVGGVCWYYVIYPVDVDPLYGLGEMILFEDLFANPALYVGTIVYFEGLDVTAVTDNGDGTRTITVTDGTNTVNIVGCEAGEKAAAGDSVFFGYFVPIIVNGVLQLRPVQNGANSWVVFASDRA